jgi:hypothetical protein
MKAWLSQLSTTTGVLGNWALGQSSLKRQHLAIVPRGRRLGNARVEVAGLVAADRLSSLGWLGSGAAVVTMAAVPLTAHITRHREGAKLWIDESDRA